MSNIRVNTTELMQVLEMTPAHHNLMLVGRHGIGKSEILTEYFSQQGMPVVALFLGQMADPGDLIGIPNKNEQTGKTEFMPPYWFPLDGKPIVLFLDELNRARRIISAVNEGEQYQLTDLDPALVSRFNIINFQPTVQEWLLWAKREEVDPRVISFIERNDDAKENEDTGLDKTPDRRAWKRVSDIIKGAEVLTSLHQKVIASVVGAKATVAFMAAVNNKKVISGKDILYSFEKAKDKLKPYTLHEMSIVNEGVFRLLEVEKIPAEKKEEVKKNLEAYFDYLVKERKEAAAHFANLYVQQTYPNAVAFIARECQVLTMTLVLYVKSIR